MKAVIIKNKELYWESVPDPELADGEVLVKVYAAAVNRADLMQVEGNYPPPPGAPDWPGLEISGTVTALSETAQRQSPWKIGDKVCALLGGGGYAEYAAVHHDMLMPIPEHCTMEEAAALPEAFATAYLNLCIEGGIKSGDTVLMHAGASGLASVVIPMAKAFGAKVITTIIDENKREAVAKTGADIIVNTQKEDIVGVLQKLERGGTPVNLAIDCLGGEVMGRCLPHLGYMAKWIMIATLAGDLSEVDMRKLYVKNTRLIGSTLRSKPSAVKAEILRALVQTVWSRVSSGEIRPAIYKVLPISRVADAHALLSENKSAGKVVLTLDHC